MPAPTQELPNDTSAASSVRSSGSDTAGAAASPVCSLGSHRGPNLLHQSDQRRVGRHRMADQPVLQDLILIGQQTHEGLAPGGIEVVEAGVEESIQEQIELEHAAAALPT